MPKVSVVTPTYNRSSTLPRAIKSVRKQTFGNYEHIIVDDGSTDETEEVVKNVGDERVRYIQLPENRGANAARNRGIKEAEGKYISFLDSDDEYLPRRLEVTTNTLDNHPDAAGAFTSYKVIDGSDQTDISISRNSRVSLDDLVDENVIGGTSCTMFRSDILDTVGGFDERFQSTQDYDLYLRVLTHSDLIGIEEVLSIYYTDEKSIRDDLEAVRQGQNLLEEKHGGILSDKRLSRHHYNRSFIHASRGEMRKTREELRTAISIYPRDPLYYYHYLTALGGQTLFDSALKLKKRVKITLT